MSEKDLIENEAEDAEIEEEIEESEDQEIDQPELESEDGSDPDEEQDDEPDAEEETEPDDVFSVTIGEDEDSPSSDGNSVIRTLRERHRETAKENRELKQRLQSYEAQAEGVPEVGEKPTLASCGYDEGVHDREIQQWYDRKHKRDEYDRAQNQKREAMERDWQDRLNTYSQQRTKLDTPDFEQVEGHVMSVLSDKHRAAIMEVADNAPLLVYALGKDDARLESAAKFNPDTQMAQFIKHIVKLEGKLQVTSKPKTKPETRVKGRSGGKGGSKSRLEALKAKARTSGDWSAYYEAKRAAS